MYGRFRRSLDLRDLLLMASLVLFAGSNLLFSTIPAIANLGPGPFVTWAPAAGGAVATALFAAGAFTRPRTIRRPGVAAGRVFLLCLEALAVIALLTLIARDWLPQAIEPGLSPEADTRPRIVGDPAVLALQLVLHGALRGGGDRLRPRCRADARPAHALVRDRCDLSPPSRG